MLTISEQARKAASILASSKAAARSALATLQSAHIPCREGLACISVSLRKRICLPESGKFLIIYKAKYMYAITFSLVCAEPDSSEACIVDVNGERIEFNHGTTVLNRTNCSRCLCVNGRLRFCKQAKENCTAHHLTGRHSCTVESRGEIQHGEKFRVLINSPQLLMYDTCITLQVDCNICGCRFGRLSCTHRRCDGGNQTQIENRRARCLRCHFQPRNPVCGPNGRTYASYCHAVECVGLPPVTLLRGPCTDYVCPKKYNIICHATCKVQLFAIAFRMCVSSILVVTEKCASREVHPALVYKGVISDYVVGKGACILVCWFNLLVYAHLLSIVDPAQLVCEEGEVEEDRCTRHNRNGEQQMSVLSQLLYCVNTQHSMYCALFYYTVMGQLLFLYMACNYDCFSKAAARIDMDIFSYRDNRIRQQN